MNPIVRGGFIHMAGTNTYQEALDKFDINIKNAPPMDRPLLIFHSGRDRLIPDTEKHANCFINWTVGEKELKNRRCQV